MAFEFIPYEREPEPQAAGSRLGGPPRKRIGLGVLDPPLRPGKPADPNPAIERSPFSRGIVIMILVGLAALIVAVAWRLL